MNRHLGDRGVLHGAAEDQGGERMLDEIRRRFGSRVASIVAACSDTLDPPSRPGRHARGATSSTSRASPSRCSRVSLADKLFNARAILRDHLGVGDDVWTRFQFVRDGQLWYYGQLAERFAVLLPGRMAAELSEVVHALVAAATDR